MKPLNQYIDHTLLKSSATKYDIITLCEEAKQHQFYAVCVNSCYVNLAKEQLKNSTIKVCSVIGFPLGCNHTEAKVYEAKQALIDGADEIDMVMNSGLLKSKDFYAVQKDIIEVKNCMSDKVLKLILETCYLDTDEIITASKLAIQSGADFIKTSTGFGTRGATFHDIKLIKQATNGQVKIKASGGIKDYKTALEYIHLGVERIGTSSGISIVSKTISEDKNY